MILVQKGSCMGNTYIKDLKLLMYDGEEIYRNEDVVHTFLHKWSDLPTLNDIYLLKARVTLHEGKSTSCG